MSKRKYMERDGYFKNKTSELQIRIEDEWWNEYEKQ